MNIPMGSDFQNNLNSNAVLAELARQLDSSSAKFRTQLDGIQMGITKDFKSEIKTLKSSFENFKVDLKKWTLEILEKKMKTAKSESLKGFKHFSDIMLIFKIWEQ